LDSLGIRLDFLGFSWIPSSDSGLFNGLRAIPRKNNFDPSGPQRRPRRIKPPSGQPKSARSLWCQPFHTSLASLPPPRRFIKNNSCHGFRKASRTEQESLAPDPSPAERELGDSGRSGLARRARLVVEPPQDAARQGDIDPFDRVVERRGIDRDERENQPANSGLARIEGGEPLRLLLSLKSSLRPAQDRFRGSC
jgi:hypothetical protein